MRDIRWTDRAILSLAHLTERQRKILLDRLELISQFPDMYPIRQHRRFAGLRYFAVERRWLVYYRPSAEQVLIFDIVPALSRPR